MSTISPWKRASRLLAASLAVATLVAADEPGKRPPESAKPRESARSRSLLNRRVVTPQTWSRHERVVARSSRVGRYAGRHLERRADDRKLRLVSHRRGPDPVRLGRHSEALRPRRRPPHPRSEFPGDDSDFSRLDRDRDKALSAADFDFSGSALSSSPGAMLFIAPIPTAMAKSRETSWTRSGRPPIVAARGSCRSLTCRRRLPLRRPGRRQARAGLRRRRWSGVSSARRSARSSPGQRSTSLPPTSP